MPRLVWRVALMAAALFVFAAHAQGFMLASPDMQDGHISEEQVYNGFGCAGKNVSPALSWSGAPLGTKSYTLIVHDPDAPTDGAGWWHWVVVDIPVDVSSLAKDAGRADGSGLPRGARQLTSDFGMPGWGGPCPPAGDNPHRYVFTLYAIKTEHLDLPKDANASLAASMANAQSKAKTTLTARYGRTK